MGLNTGALTGFTVVACLVLAVFQVTGNSGRVVLFNEEPKGPHPIPVMDGHGFGTNSAFIGMGDGQGTSVKGRTTQLMQPDRFKAGYRPALHTKPAGPMGTNQAFVGKMDGAGQSTKGRAQMLDQEYNQYGQKARAFFKKAGLMTKGESKWASSMQTGAEKAPVQMLADKPAGYRPSVWTQIGAQDPAQNARQVMKQNEDFGYKAPVQMLSQKHNPYPSVWRQIGSTEPSQQAQSVMSQSDNFGYKAAPQMLAECGKGGACPSLAKALKKAGLTSAAEAKWVAKMPVEGFKSSVVGL